MGSAVKLREDFSAADLRRLAKRSRDANPSRRLLPAAAVREGKDRSEAARVGGMDRQTLRDWVHRFNAHGPDGLLDHHCEGPKPRLTDCDVLHADKGYDSNAISRQVRDRGAWANIPPKANRIWKNAFSPFLYRNRNAIERMFCRLKDFRRVATRYDRNAASWTVPSTRF